MLHKNETHVLQGWDVTSSCKEWCSLGNTVFIWRSRENFFNEHKLPFSVFLLSWQSLPDYLPIVPVPFLCLTCLGVLASHQFLTHYTPFSSAIWVLEHHGLFSRVFVTGLAIFLPHFCRKIPAQSLPMEYYCRQNVGILVQDLESLLSVYEL